MLRSRSKIFIVFYTYYSASIKNLDPRRAKVTYSEYERKQETSTALAFWVLQGAITSLRRGAVTFSTHNLLYLATATALVVCESCMIVWSLRVIFRLSNITSYRRYNLPYQSLHKKIKYKVLFWGLDSLEDDQSTTEKDVASRRSLGHLWTPSIYIRTTESSLNRDSTNWNSQEQWW